MTRLVHPKRRNGHATRWRMGRRGACTSRRVVPVSAGPGWYPQPLPLVSYGQGPARRPGRDPSAQPPRGGPVTGLRAAREWENWSFGRNSCGRRYSGGRAVPVGSTRKGRGARGAVGASGASGAGAAGPSSRLRRPAAEGPRTGLGLRGPVLQSGSALKTALQRWVSTRSQPPTRRSMSRRLGRGRSTRGAGSDKVRETSRRKRSTKGP